ncbi:Uncharacterised protein [Kocuria rosea]|jgi:hypothetical protein|nr:hypothetical protein FHX38_1099 [Kocuria rosea]STX03425.1 Uncharacterised protein [Kocuria rosea]VEI51836.1 Uncharacterised protein [Kocuria rosea]
MTTAPESPPGITGRRAGGRPVQRLLPGQKD